jgi:hypothetical protein
MARAVDDDPSAGRSGLLNGLPALGEQRIEGLAQRDRNVLTLRNRSAGLALCHQQQEWHRDSSLRDLAPEEPIHVHGGVAAPINAAELCGCRTAE